MTAKKVATFRHGDRVVHMIDIPDGELDEYLADIAKELALRQQEIEAEEAAKPGFINDCRKR